ncbi:hypothetical protein [Azospirillum rugosum]|uniref:Uncharacterized protein n=1 Tax=Azospirillum rugosum TaxID=416170 RepID=A0ABS4SE39_9PROT|nr:hypothetical protein [Azospirillum rugosum]MBP2290449.1 hypothetical protein [Azospirillum rugosum]MDQ0527925.1 hypothetical protein [Azospirillum rugosum]
MARWMGFPLLGLGLLALGLQTGLSAPALAETAVPASTAPPSAFPVACAGDGPARRCTASAVEDFANNRGGQSELSLNAVRDGTCTTLHIVFDGPIALDRPVTLTVDGAPPQRFYTPGALSELARALDDGKLPDDAPPEFASFLQQVTSGRVKDADAGPEMLTRFAAVKEARRVGLTCGPMERLLPLLRTGHTARLEFQVANGTKQRVYHWLRLDSRVVTLRVDDLLASLDRAMPGS